MKTKEAVLRLMIACHVISTEDIQIDPSTWKTILSSFSAGLSRLDVLIRTLVIVCSEDSTPFMDELRWKGCDREDNQEQQLPKKRFDWFIDALDTGRIRNTVLRFPVFDTIDFVIDLESVCAEQSEIAEDKNGDSSPSSQYSPAFLLPLILETIVSRLRLNSNNKIGADGFLMIKTRDMENGRELISQCIFSKIGRAHV